MAHTLTKLTSGSADNFGPSQATASITPASDSPVFCHVIIYDADNPPAAPTISGCSLTWSLVNSQAMTAYVPVKLFTFKGLGTATSGALTITPAKSSGNYAAWIVEQISSIDGATPVVQSVPGHAASATTLSITLAAFGSAANPTYGVFAYQNTNQGMTPGSGFTLETTINQSSIVRLTGTEFQDANDTSVDASYAGAAVEWAGIAFELKDAVPAASPRSFGLVLA